MKKILLLSFILSGQVFAECKEDFFKYLKAGNANLATGIMQRKCSAITAPDEFGEEERIFTTFRDLSTPLLGRLDNCRSYYESNNIRENLKLKECLQFKVLVFYKKRLGDPLKEMEGNWRQKYKAAKSKYNKKIASQKTKELKLKKAKDKDLKTKFAKKNKSVKENGYFVITIFQSGDKIFVTKKCENWKKFAHLNVSNCQKTREDDNSINFFCQLSRSSSSAWSYHYNEARCKQDLINAERVR